MISEERERVLQLLAQVTAELMGEDWEDTDACFRHVTNALFTIETLLRYHCSGETTK